MNTLPKQKISLIGSNGFLSNAIEEFAIASQWDMKIYGRRPPLKVRSNDFYQIDLLHKNLDVDSLLDSSVIIYAAGAGIQSNKMDSKEQIYKLNTFVPINICNKLEEQQYKGTFISFGSIFEIGETQEKHPFTEESILSSTAHAPSDYVISKRMLTSFVSSYNHNFKHLHFIIPTIYGKNENTNRLIPYTINSIKNNEIPHFSSGEQIRQYLHVSEVPPIIAKSLQNRIPSGIYNIEGSQTLSVRDVVHLIYDFFGKQCSSNSFGSTIKADTAMKYLALDGKKLQDVTGFVPKIKIEDIISSY